MSAKMSIRTLVAALAITTLPQVALAGPLNPPDGMPGPTMKTLEQVEPRRPINMDTVPGDGTAFYIINQSGSYYLTGMAIVTGDIIAIQVNAPNVVIDLNGFMVVRATPAASTKPLIRVSNSAYGDVTIKNGTIRNAGGHGIELAGPNCRVENVTVTTPGGHGIYAYGARNQVLNCIIDTPKMDGINVGDEAIVMNSQVQGSTTHGITAGANSEVRSSRVKTAGQNGINVGSGTLVQDCTVSTATAFGIAAQFNTGTQRFINNTVTNCGSGGMRIYSTSQVVGNSVNLTGLNVPGLTILSDGSRVQNNLFIGGSHAVTIDASGDDNLVFGNQAVNPGTGNGFGSVNVANNQVGPIVTAGGTIASTNPFANFSH
ncbi:MAG: right-handed parallel beta-helix repeat-containing protein [Phycisphaeraceae bacterium]|nr:right-handed parallel beta-helix repeat-containing protein [Phycisphaeraceae bacterium]